MGGRSAFAGAAGPADDGRANGAGIATDGCTGRGGAAGGTGCRTGVEKLGTTGVAMIGVGAAEAGTGGGGWTAGRATTGVGAAGAGGSGGAAGVGGVGGAGGAGGAAMGGAMGTPAGAVAKSARASAIELIVMIPPQTEHRARTAPDGIFAGSTRNTELHSGQLTFMRCPPHESRSSAPRSATRPPAGCPYDGRPNRPTPRVSWRSSSFRLRVRSLALRA